MNLVQCFIYKEIVTIGTPNIYIFQGAKCTFLSNWNGDNTNKVCTDLRS